MNAQSETWTAEKAIRSAMMFVKHPRERAALEVGLAIVRLHPELVGMLEDIRVDGGYEKVSALNDLLARAHALGENNANNS